jgi:hypothetical protein
MTLKWERLDLRHGIIQNARSRTTLARFGNATGFIDAHGVCDEIVAADAKGDD